MTRTSLPEPTTVAPEALRWAMEAWRQHRLSNAELMEASYKCMLDLVKDYGPKLLPTEPEEVRSYRVMTAQEQRQISAEARHHFSDRYSRFFVQERAIILANHDNRRTLKELLAWATAKKLPRPVLAKITEVLHAHDEPHDDTPEPFLVHAAPGETASPDPDLARVR